VVALPGKVPDGKQTAASLLFTTPQGAALHRSSFNAVAWQLALRGAGIPLSRDSGMHALRHYFASALLHNGVDIRALASFLGHADPGFTLRTYTHLMPSADDRMRSAVDTDFAQWETEMSDGPETAQGRRR
jgi:site-specific recombinase XerD